MSRRVTKAEILQRFHQVVGGRLFHKLVNQQDLADRYEVNQQERVEVATRVAAIS